MKFYGERIKELREGQGWTQQELADQVMRSKQYICKIELGHANPPAALLSGLSRVFGVSIDYFFSDQLPSRNNTCQ